MQANFEKIFEGFPDRLRKVIADSGLSQAKFAAAIGEDHFRLKNVLSGNIRPSGDLIKKVITLAKVDAVWFVTGEKLNLGEISPHEAILLSNYRLLSASEQATVAIMVAALAKQANKK